METSEMGGNKEVKIMERFDIRELKAVEQVIRSGELSRFFTDFRGGRFVQAFEQEFADYIGSKNAISVSNGTVALEVALASLGLEHDDEVITTPLTFIATASAILRVGAKPVFVDIRRDTLNMDELLIERTITQRTKAILSVSLLGMPADIGQIRRIADEHDLFLIEDAAQSLGAVRYRDGKKIGAWGDLGCFNAHTKILTTEGNIPISRVKVGDYVINRSGACRVKEIHKKKYDGKWVRLRFGKMDSSLKVSMTSNHPVLVWRNKKELWLKADEIKSGDSVYVQTTNCELCGQKIPIYRRLCVSCYPAQLSSARMKLSKIHKTGSKKKLSRHIHFLNDIKPVMEKYEKDGYRVIPIDSIYPDFIALKNGKVYAVEVENKVTPKLSKKQNYVLFDRKRYYDDVIWVTTKDAKPHGNTYEITDDGAFARVPVLKVEHYFHKDSRHKSRDVYNLSVEGDPSYIAQKILVHNSFSFQETKTITSMGEGGMIVTDDPFKADLCRHIRNHGNVYGNIPLNVPCTNARMTEAQAAFGRVQLQKLNDFNKIQKKNALELIKNLKRPLECVYPSCYRDLSTYYLIPFTLDKTSKLTRDEFIQKCRDADLSQGLPGQNISYYKKLVTESPVFQNLFKKQHYPNAEWARDNILLFDIHRWNKTPVDMRTYSDTINKFWR